MRGGSIALIYFFFRLSRVTPVDQILCSSHSHSFWAELHFVSFKDRFSLSNFLRNFSAVDIFSLSKPLVTFKISSINASDCGYSERIESITR